MKEYRRRNTRAIQWNGDNAIEIGEAIGEPVYIDRAGRLVIPHKHEDERVTLGHWIIPDPTNEYAPYRTRTNDEFRFLYEEV